MRPIALRRVLFLSVLAPIACGGAALASVPAPTAAGVSTGPSVAAELGPMAAPASGEPEPTPVPELSTATSDTVRNPDGSYTATISGAPVNYKDEGGNWVPIDNTLVEAPGPAYAVENAANAYTVSIPEDPSVTPVKFEVGDAWVTMRLAGSEDVDPDVIGDEATFADLTAAADEVSYQATDTGVKEIITLRSVPTSAVSFVYNLKVGGGVAPILTDQGAVEFRDETGKARFVIPVGTMTDSASPEPAFSAAVEYELDQTPAGWKFTITPAMGWLTDSSRVYPVMIDPTVDKITQKDCWVGQEQGSFSWCGTDRIKAGRTGGGKLRRALLDFNLQNLPSADQITNATAYMYTDPGQSSGSGGGSTWALYEPSQTWTSCATWNYADCNGTAWNGGGLGGQIVSQVGWLDGSAAGWVGWAITDAVKRWVNHPNSYRGVLLRQTNEATNRVIAFYSSTSAVGPYWNARPLLRVTYVDTPVISGVTVGPCPRQCHPTDAEVATLSPTLSAVGSTPNSNWVNYVFETYNNSKTTLVDSGTVSYYPNYPVSWTVPGGKLNDDRKYQVRVGIWDGYVARWSGFRSIRTDLEPAVPTEVRPGVDSDESHDLHNIALSFGITDAEAYSLYAWTDEFSASVKQMYEQFPASFSYAEMNPEGVAGARYVFKGDVPPGAHALTGSVPVANTFEEGASYSDQEMQDLVRIAGEAILDELGTSAPSSQMEVSMNETNDGVEALVYTPSTSAAPTREQLRDAVEGSFATSAPEIFVPNVDIQFVEPLGYEPDTLRGGVALSNNPSSTNTDVGCTTGFPARDSRYTDVIGVLTADHCDKKTVYSSNYTDLKREILSEVPRRMDRSLGDIEFIPVDPANRAHEGLGYSFYTGVGKKRTLEDYDPIEIGMPLCLFGRRTNQQKCAEVEKKHVTVTYDDSDRTYHNLVQLEGDQSSGGDSGGPVYYGNIAYGMISGSRDGFGPFFERTLISPLWQTVARPRNHGGLGITINTESMHELYGN